MTAAPARPPAPAAPPTPPPDPPADIGPDGRRLWTATCAKYELREDEYSLLRGACHVLDRIEQLDRQVRTDGLMIPGAGGVVRVHPAVAEARQQRLTLARLLTALRLPDDDDDEQPLHRPQRRGLRGVYSLKPGGVA